MENVEFEFAGEIIFRFIGEIEKNGFRRFNK